MPSQSQQQSNCLRKISRKVQQTPNKTVSCAAACHDLDPAFFSSGSHHRIVLRCNQLKRQQKITPPAAHPSKPQHSNDLAATPR
jgi:hypothetical protein